MLSLAPIPVAELEADIPHPPAAEDEEEGATAIAPPVPTLALVLSALVLENTPPNQLPELRRARLLLLTGT